MLMQQARAAELITMGSNPFAQVQQSPSALLSHYGGYGAGLSMPSMPALVASAGGFGGGVGMLPGAAATAHLGGGLAWQQLLLQLQQQQQQQQQQPQPPQPAGAPGGPNAQPSNIGGGGGGGNHDGPVPPGVTAQAGGAPIVMSVNAGVPHRTSTPALVLDASLTADAENDSEAFGKWLGCFGLEAFVQPLVHDGVSNLALLRSLEECDVDEIMLEHRMQRMQKRVFKREWSKLRGNVGQASAVAVATAGVATAGAATAGDSAEGRQGSSSSGSSKSHSPPPPTAARGATPPTQTAAQGAINEAGAAAAGGLP